jgi:hypothetical protein
MIALLMACRSFVCASLCLNIYVAVRECVWCVCVFFFLLYSLMSMWCLLSLCVCVCVCVFLLLLVLFLGVSLACIYGVSHLNKSTPGFETPNLMYCLISTIAGLMYGWVWRRTHYVTVSALAHGAVLWVWWAFFGYITQRYSW